MAPPQLVAPTTRGPLRNSRSNVQLAPGSEIALSFPNSILRFRAGITDYEIAVHVPDRGAGEGDDEDDPLDAEDEDEGDTIALGDIMLTPEQRLLLLALGESTLRDPHSSDELPPESSTSRRAPSPCACATNAVTALAAATLRSVGCG